MSSWKGVWGSFVTSDASCRAEILVLRNQSVQGRLSCRCPVPASAVPVQVRRSSVSPPLLLVSDCSELELASITSLASVTVWLRPRFGGDVVVFVVRSRDLFPSRDAPVDALVSLSTSPTGCTPPPPPPSRPPAPPLGLLALALL